MTRPVRPKSLPAHGGFDPKHWAGLSPYGLGRQKPDHFGEMAKTAWQNRRALPYAWRILTQGVCDGCALGTTGLSDWTMQGVHLCTVRLNLLHLNTMPLPAEFAKDLAAFPAVLRELVEAELAAGNAIAEITTGFPAPPVGLCLKLTQNLMSRPRESGAPEFQL